MGRGKKIISIILIISFLLSLIPDSSYNKGRVLAGCQEDEDCDNLCQTGCTPKCSQGNCYCLNCPIKCDWGEESFKNKGCLPISGEWACGREIPIGEVLDKTNILASKMAGEFETIIERASLMAKKTSEILKDIPSWSCDMCQTDCYKYYLITKGLRQDTECQNLDEWDQEIEVSRSIYPAECNQDYTQCESCTSYCAEEENKKDCCWKEEKEIPDPENPEETITITCKYCQSECQEAASYFPCGGYGGAPGCCSQYFGPILGSFSTIQAAREELIDDIEEKDLPEKLKRSYILEQLDFSRCELGKCFVPAEDWPDVLTGKKVGKYLFTCQRVKEMELLEEDQINCSLLQAGIDLQEFLEYVAQKGAEAQEVVEKFKEEPWWKKIYMWPVVLAKITIKLDQIAIESVKLIFKYAWKLLEVIFKKRGEEACWPTNYYCCII